MACSRRCFTIDHKLSQALDREVPKGERSGWVNQVLDAALRREDTEAAAISLAGVISVFAAVLAVSGALQWVA